MNVLIALDGGFPARFRATAPLSTRGVKERLRGRPLGVRNCSALLALVDEIGIG